MPVIVQKKAEAPTAKPPITDASGRLTLEAQTIASFLSDCDWSDLFQNPQLRSHVRKQRMAVKEDSGRMVVVPDGTAGATTCEMETIQGPIAAAAADAKDIMACFAHYLSNEHPNESLAHRVALNLFSDGVGAHESAVMEVIGNATFCRPANKQFGKKMNPMMMNKPTMAPKPPAMKPNMPMESVKKIRCVDKVDEDVLRKIGESLAVPRTNAESLASPHGSVIAGGGLRAMQRQTAPPVRPVTEDKRKALTKSLMLGTFGSTGLGR
jgi:hypothetical protein